MFLEHAQCPQFAFFMGRQKLHQPAKRESARKFSCSGVQRINNRLRRSLTFSRKNSIKAFGTPPEREKL